jgi:hypothetical protein
MYDARVYHYFADGSVANSIEYVVIPRNKNTHACYKTLKK